MTGISELVDLSRLDSNKYKAILRYKRQIANDLAIVPTTITRQDKAELSHTINEFGEIEATQLKQSHRSFSSQEVEAIIIAYQNGKSTYTLAEEFGCHRMTITKTLKRHGVIVDNRRAMKKLNEGEVVSLYATMHTTEEIAKRFHVHPQAIIRCLKSHGVKIRSRWDYIRE